MQAHRATSAAMLTVGLALCSVVCAGCGPSSKPGTKVLRTGGDTHRQRSEAARARQAKQFDAAIAKYEALLSEVGDDSSALAELRHQLSLCHWERAGRLGGEPATAETLARDQAGAIQYARDALSDLEQQGQQAPVALYAKVSWSLGGYLRGQGRVDQALEQYQRLLDRLDEDDINRVQTLHELGNAYLERSGRRGDTPPTMETDRQDLDSAFARQTEAMAIVQAMENAPPLLSAWIHNSLGLIHQRRMEAALAADSFAEAERICAEHGQPEQHSGVLLNLILALVEAGRLEDVRARCEELKALPGAAGEPRTLAALGFAALQLGDYDEARQQFDLARYAARVDPKCRDDLSFQAQLATNAATCAQAIGKYEEAERHLTDAHERLEAGGLDPRTSAVIRANLGRMYLTLERLDEAETQFEAVLAVFRELQGPKHPDTLLVLLDLASLARVRGHVAEARQRYEDALAGLAAARGADHPQTAQAQLELAGLLRDQGQCGKALAGATAALEILDERLGANHKQSVQACLQAALIAADCRELAEGAAQFQRLAREAGQRFAHLRETLGANNAEVLRATVYFADVTARTPAAFARALEKYREAEAGYRELFGDGVLSLADLRLRQGRLLEQMKRPDDAFRVYERAHRDMDSSLQRHPTRAALLAAMGDLCQAKGQAEQASRLWQEAYNILTSTYGADHPRVKQFSGQRGR